MYLRSAAFALASSCLAARAVRAHSCLPDADGPTAGARGLRFTTLLTAAEYRSRRYEGSYQGLGLSVGWERPRLALSAGLSSYRLVRNGAAQWGLGDLMAAAKVRALQRGRISAGVTVMGSLPTGDSGKGLGMGHVMLMPALWAAMYASRIALGAAVGYAAALGSPSAHQQHGAGPAPLVDPMNPMELTGDVGISYQVHSQLRLHGQLRGALPVVLPGEARLIAALGGQVQWGAFALGVEGQTPLVGTPFSARGVLTVAYFL